MLFNTSYKNKDYTRESFKLLGSPYSFIEKIKMGGIGSSRLIIEELSNKLKPINMHTTAIGYANIELRPRGIIVHFSNRLKRYSWIIPYYRLITYSNVCFSIHSNGNFIKFKKNKNYINNKNFLFRMTQLKVSYLNLGYYDV